MKGSALAKGIYGRRACVGVVALLLCWLGMTGCPFAPGQPGKQYPLKNYIPLQEGNAWTWEFVSAVKDGEKYTADVSLTLGEKTNIEGCDTWEFSVDAPLLVFLTFSLYLGFDGAGYIVETEDGFYVAKNSDSLENLPSTDGLSKVPIAMNLGDGVVRIVEGDETYWEKYRHGALSELLPEGVTMDDLGSAIGDPAECVAVYKSYDGLVWSDTKAILAENLGMVLGNSVVGRFLLRRAVLGGQELVF